jgi:dipeptidase E
VDDETRSCQGIAGRVEFVDPFCAVTKNELKPRVFYVTIEWRSVTEISEVGNRSMRKLIFYSDQIAPLTDPVDRRLIQLFKVLGPTIGYISSAVDTDRFHYERCQEYYDRYGIDVPVYVDPDASYQPGLINRLFGCDAIHLSGGNTFSFLHWLKMKGLMPPIREYVKNGGILIGISAGAILMTPDITTSSLCGDTQNDQPDNFMGLNLVDFSFVPHIETIPVWALQEYSRRRKCELFGCHDGDGIIVDGETRVFVGDLVRIKNGEIVPVES